MGHNATIKAWISEVTHIPSSNVFLLNQNGPAPVGDYACFTVLDSQLSQNELKDVIDIDETTKTGNERFMHRDTITVQVDVFADNGHELLNKLYMSRAVWFIRKALHDGGLTLNARSQVRDLSEAGAAMWGARFAADFTFLAEALLSTTTDLDSPQDMFDEVAIAGTFKKE